MNLRCYDQFFDLHWPERLHTLCSYAAGVNTFTRKKGHLCSSFMPMALQTSQEENMPYLSRKLLRLKDLPLQTSSPERISIKDARW